MYRPRAIVLRMMKKIQCWYQKKISNKITSNMDKLLDTIHNNIEENNYLDSFEPGE